MFGGIFVVVFEMGISMRFVLKCFVVLGFGGVLYGFGVGFVLGLFFLCVLFVVVVVGLGGEGVGWLCCWWEGNWVCRCVLLFFESCVVFFFWCVGL